MGILKKIISGLLILTTMCFCFSCSNNDNKDSSGSGSTTESTSSSGGDSSDTKPDENVKIINDELFKNPSLSDRPMVMMHSSTQGLITDVLSRGYGGVVTNVSWSNNYLNNEREWSSLQNVIDFAIDNGMYVWLYDEYGYPSGCARGQTLSGNPEYEALGLVSVKKVVGAGDVQTIDLLYGHNEIVDAFVYDGSDTDNADLSSGISVKNLINEQKNSITYANRTKTSKILVVYMSKRWYEKTHAMENWYAQQRYINMLDKEPAEKFISITHEKYYEYLGEHFGKGIKAFFTDEPALQGNYFDLSDRNRTVIDTPDMNIPILECLNYSDRLFDYFKQTYGYSLEDKLGYLYMDDNSDVCRKVRMDFYLLTGELFRNNYLQKTSDWCDAHGVKSSGHLLLEESLFQNVWFAGNMIQLLGTMGIPGTDLLYSTAARAAQDACITSKFAGSAADFTGKTDTFAEISGAFDGTAGDMYSQLNAVGAQVAFGINNFASYYYQGNNHTKEEDKIFSAAIGRMRYMVTGSEHRAKTLVYYPYEGVAAETLPTMSMWLPREEAREVSDSFTDVCRGLTAKQIDYDLTDYINLSKMEVKDNALVSPNGERFEAIVLPYTNALRSEAVEKLAEAASRGVKIYLVGGIEKVVCEFGKSDVEKQFVEKVLPACVTVTSGAAAAKRLRDEGMTYAVLDDLYSSDVYITKRENANYSVFTVVNAYAEDKTTGFTLEAAKGNKVRYYDAVSGEITEITATRTGNKLRFMFTLPANRTGFFTVS